MGFYSGKNVLIIGGSKGIGRSLAELLAAKGASVWVAARGQDALEATVDALKVARPAGNHGWVSIDVTDEAAVAEGCQQVIDALGYIDILICNSGFAVTGSFVDSPTDHFERMIQVNLMGHVHAVKALAPHFIERGAGDICLVSSMMGFLPLYGYSAYSASKFAIVGFGESLRQELKGHGVRVTMYYPPTTKTPGLDKENEDKPPVVLALETDNSFSKTYESADVAASMARCIERGVVHGIIGADSKFIHAMNRFLPGLTRYFTDGEVSAAQKKVATQQGDA